MLAGLGYGLEVKGVVVNSELAMLRCSWKWKPSFGLGIGRERDLGGGCLFLAAPLATAVPLLSPLLPPAP